MKNVLLLALILVPFVGMTQYTEPLCEIVRKMESYKAEGTLGKFKAEKINPDGSYYTTSLPARFAEGHYRSLGAEAHSISYRSYGRAKDIDKIWGFVKEELLACYPNLEIDASAENNELYQKYIFCSPEEKGKKIPIRDYDNLAITVRLVYKDRSDKKNEESMIEVVLQ